MFKIFKPYFLELGCKTYPKFAKNVKYSTHKCSLEEDLCGLKY